MFYAFVFTSLFNCRHNLLGLSTLLALTGLTSCS